MDRGWTRPPRQAWAARLGIVLVLAWAAATPGDAGQVARPEQAAARFLAEKYPPPRRNPQGNSIWTITPIFDPEAVIRDVSSRRLEPRIPPSRLLEVRMPATRFCVTTMRSVPEFPVVPTLVAVERARDGTWRGVQECLSPMFIKPNPEFLALFRGIATDSDVERARIGLEIAILFKEATPAFQVWRARYADRQFTCELWEGNRHFRTVAVRFDPTGLLQDVRLSYPDQPPRPVGPAPDMPK